MWPMERIPWDAYDDEEVVNFEEYFEDKDHIEEVDREPPVTAVEFHTALSRIKLNKATGVDAISADLWKNCDYSLKSCLKLLLNAMRKESYQLTLLNVEQLHSPKRKMLVIVPITLPKEENACDCSNYRMLAILFPACKILIIIIKDRNNVKIEQILDSKYWKEG